MCFLYVQVASDGDDMESETGVVVNDEDEKDGVWSG